MGRERAQRFADLMRNGCLLSSTFTGMDGSRYAFEAVKRGLWRKMFPSMAPGPFALPMYACEKNRPKQQFLNDVAKKIDHNQSCVFKEVLALFHW